MLERVAQEVVNWLRANVINPSADDIRVATRSKATKYNVDYELLLTLVQNMV